MNEINNTVDDEVRNRHYRVEKELAARLKNSVREDRPEIYRTMYSELLEKVPEHSRLSESVTDEQMEIGLVRQIRLVEKYLSNSTRLLEFAPGTCRFSYKVASIVANVMAVDISDQRIDQKNDPDNFKHIIYDGYNLVLDDAMVDLVFSNQFIEHIHPDDMLLHLSLANRVLKTGGHYIFSTPHLFMGPWDVSSGFSEVAECFHLKEWTCGELDRVLHEAGFSKTTILIWVKGRPIVVPSKKLYLFLETIFSKFNYRLRKKLSRYLFTQILFVAEK